MDEWDEKAVERFESMVQVAHWKKLISKVVAYKERKSFAFQRQSKQRESSPIPGVELYDPEENADKNIAMELVKLGFAEMSNKKFGDLTKSSILNMIKDPAAKEKTKEEVPVPEETAKLPEMPSKPELETNNNKSISNGDEKRQKLQQPEPESLFMSGETPKKKKKGKEQLTDFLKSEQQATTKKQKSKEVDWNEMMDD